MERKQNESKPTSRTMPSEGAKRTADAGVGCLPCSVQRDLGQASWASVGGVARFQSRFPNPDFAVSAYRHLCQGLPARSVGLDWDHAWPCCLWHPVFSTCPAVCCPQTQPLGHLPSSRGTFRPSDRIWPLQGNS
jgi:hypothetical protein